MSKEQQFLQILLQLTSNANLSLIQKESLLDEAMLISKGITNWSSEELETQALQLCISLLQNGTERQAEKACNLLQVLLATKTFAYIMQHYKALLYQALQQDLPQIQILALSQVKKCLVDPHSSLPCLLRENNDLTIILLKSLEFTDLTYVEELSNFLEQLCIPIEGNDQGLKWMISSDSIKVLSDLIDLEQDVLSLRVLDLVARILVVIVSIETNFENEFLEECLNNGFVDLLIQEKAFQSNDPLYLMNYLEIFTKVLSAKPGNLKKALVLIDYLKKKGIFQHLLMLLLDGDEDDLNRTSIIQLFTNSFKNYPITCVLEESNKLIKYLQDLLSSYDEMNFAVAVMFANSLAESAENLTLLIHSDYFKEFAELFPRANDDRLQVFLHSISILLQERESLNVLKRQAFNYLAQMTGGGPFSFLDLLLRSIKRPFKELRLAAYATLQSLASYEWGWKIIIEAPELIDALLDRDLDQSVDGQEWKYSIVRHLSNVAQLPDPLRTRITAFIREGPFYRPLKTAVTLKSS